MVYFPYGVFRAPPVQNNVRGRIVLPVFAVPRFWTSPQSGFCISLFDVYARAGVRVHGVKLSLGLIPEAFFLPLA